MKFTVLCLGLSAIALSGLGGRAFADEARAKITRVPVVFSGGHETDPRDHGRPVVLVAAALGVPTEVFRGAFRGVRPAPGGTKPTRERERQNKQVLLKALSGYGVTNERLDEVSDYYRYNPGRGELWTVRPAKAMALVKDGKVIGFEILDGGAGYSSPPLHSIPKFDTAGFKVTLSFGKDLRTNGSIASIAAPTRGTK